MTEDVFARERNMIGDEGLALLFSKRVLVVGLGGVGAAAAEALVRAGVGKLDVLDDDSVNVTNVNRQLIALLSTVGERKTDTFERRAADINPNATVTKHDLFLTEESLGKIDLAAFDYVVDAIDTVSAKIALAAACEKLGVPLISCLSTGNKLCPEMLKIADVFDTSVCPIARVMRRELKARGVSKLTVVYSEEQPQKPLETEETNGRHVPASISFVPPVAGYLLASRVVRDFLKK